MRFQPARRRPQRSAPRRGGRYQLNVRPVPEIAPIRGYSLPARVRPEPTPAPVERHVVEAKGKPRTKLKVLSKLRLRVSTDRKLQGYMGTVTLKCGAQNVDMERITKRLCVFAADHDPESKAFGRITGAECKDNEMYAVAEVLDTNLGRHYLDDIRSGLRNGISPGFEILEAKLAEDGNKKAGTFDWVITKWRPYEISSTPIPRNPDAQVISELK